MKSVYSFDPSLSWMLIVPFSLHSILFINLGLVRMNKSLFNPFMTICQTVVIITLICLHSVIIVSSLRTPSSSPLPSIRLSSGLNHGTNVTMDDVVIDTASIQDVDPHNVIKNVIGNVTNTWSSITQQSLHRPFYKDHSSTVEEKWITSANILNDLINVAIKSSLPLMLDLAYTSDLSPKCSESLLQILSGIKSNRGWALSCKFTLSFLIL